MAHVSQLQEVNSFSLNEVGKGNEGRGDELRLPEETRQSSRRTKRGLRGAIWNAMSRNSLATVREGGLPQTNSVPLGGLNQNIQHPNTGSRVVKQIVNRNAGEMQLREVRGISKDFANNHGQCTITGEQQHMGKEANVENNGQARLYNENNKNISDEGEGEMERSNDSNGRDEICLPINEERNARWEVGEPSHRQLEMTRVDHNVETAVGVTQEGSEETTIVCTNDSVPSRVG